MFESFDSLYNHVTEKLIQRVIEAEQIKLDEVANEVSTEA